MAADCVGNPLGCKLGCMLRTREPLQPPTRPAQVRGHGATWIMGLDDELAAQLADDDGASDVARQRHGTTLS